ncbi:hypothetical protein BU23DRAFT_582972 [Bimuria novae-zelandiae CBS 107.79]|uniref:Uncharacterized protein n=1 Tax=Bimuria novae-zelandiae CBS 107.79 TaxID=1447943 RepID=A0A6A5UWG2_9PLEO|nr:hypothetical protein BU23DRAFT_582972 [Bimuria novae-zelandiae CBS 107.79]
MAISTYDPCLLITNRELETFGILGYLLVLINNLTKCKRVTRSVLILEIYSIVRSVDIAIAILITLKIITERLGLPLIPLVVCIDLYSLYKCLVKLSTTNEKRLIIDIIALRQSYKRHNPADALTKVTLNRALKRFINSNMLLIRVEGSMQ